MSHTMGLLCQLCQSVLVEDRCPECSAAGLKYSGHGFTFQAPNEWAAEHFPDHPCFEPWRKP